MPPACKGHPRGYTEEENGATIFKERIQDGKCRDENYMYVWKPCLKAWGWKWISNASGLRTQTWLEPQVFLEREQNEGDYLKTLPAHRVKCSFWLPWCFFSGFWKKSRTVYNPLSFFLSTSLIQEKAKTTWYSTLSTLFKPWGGQMSVFFLQDKASHTSSLIFSHRCPITFSIRD